MSVLTGCCDACGFRHRLRKDGTMGAHYLYSGLDRDARPCEGVGKLPRHAKRLANRLAAEKDRALAS